VNFMARSFVVALCVRFASVVSLSPSERNAEGGGRKFFQLENISTGRFTII
jgi:hypothetical protein